MKRIFGIALFAISLLALFATAQPGTNSIDKLFAIDKKSGKIVSVEGVFKESPSGVIVSAGGKEKARYSSAEIVKVELGDLPGLGAEDKSLLFSLENEKDFEKASRGYGSLAKKSQQNERVRRVLEFRELMAIVKATEAKDESGFKASASDVADRLSAFAKANSKSWEVWPALQSAARLLAGLGQFDKAAGLLATLASTPELDAELKADAKLAEIDYLLRSSNAATGRTEIANLLKDKNVPSAGPARERLSLYDTWSKFSPPAPGTPAARPDELLNKLQAAIDAAKSPLARAVGFNARGELFLASGLPRDAMWEFLNVEVVYNQDKDEVTKAMRRLVQVFEAVGDKDRADQYREKLRKGR